MKDFAYKSLLLLLTLPALLPMKVLYVLADVIYIIVYHIARYRRRLVDANLAACFPEKTADERKLIRKQFYRNFADYIVETVKLLHISDKEMRKRVQFENIELLDRLTSEGRSVVLYFSHCFNWEWAPSMTLHAAGGESTDYCQVYRPLSNKLVDRLMLHIRSRFGSKSFPKATVLRELITERRCGRVTVTGFMSDQKPSHGDPTVVCTFLNRPTAFISGTETLARKLGFAAVYWDMARLGRGRYRLTCRLLHENPAELPQGALTLKYAAMLQDTINLNPSNWLWTHNRWKHPVELPAR